MKKNLVKIILLGLVTVAFGAITMDAYADTTNLPTATLPKPKKVGFPFHGKIVAVDATAATLTVGTMTFSVPPTTKISKDGKKAALADLAAGETISGYYKKDDAGTMTATTIHAGKKVEKKKALKPANTSTNAN